MSESAAKINKRLGQKPTEFELALAGHMVDLEKANSEFKTGLRGFRFTAAREVGDKKTVVVFLAVPALKQFHKILPRLIRELEKKLSDRHVLIVGHRKILPKPPRGVRLNQQRPRGTTLTAVHDALLEDLVFPSEIVGKRTQVRTDGSKLIRIALDRKDHAALEYKLDTFSSVYKTLTGKTVTFEFPAAAEL